MAQCAILAADRDTIGRGEEGEQSARETEKEKDGGDEIILKKRTNDNERVCEERDRDMTCREERDWHFTRSIMLLQ